MEEEIDKKTTVDGSGIGEALTVEVNGKVVQGGHNLPSVPDQPGNASRKLEWVDYAVAKGLDPSLAETWTVDELKTWVTGGTRN